MKNFWIRRGWVIGILLFIVILGSSSLNLALAAKQLSAPPAGKLVVSIWGNQEDLKSQRIALGKYQKLYPQVKLEIQEGDVGVDYATTKIRIAGGTMPDVFVPGIWNYHAMITDGILENLEPYIKQDKFNIKDFNTKVMNELKSLKDGKLYGLPMGFNVQSLYYNKDMFDKAGIPYPPSDGNYTWHDVREWAKKMTLDENGNTPNSPNFDPQKIVQWGLFTWAANPSASGYEPILLAFGGSTMTLPDRQKCNLEHPDSIRAWQFIQDMMWKDHSMVTPQVNQEQQGFYRWIAGHVAMQVGSHEQVVLAHSLNPSLNFDMAPLPREKAGNATVIHIHIWSIYSRSKNKEAAWHLIKWLATEGSIQGAEDRPAPLMGLIPAYKDYAFGPAFLQAPNEPAHLKEAQLDPLKWPLAISETVNNQKCDQISGQDGFGPALEAIIFNKKTAAEALKGIAKKVDAIMKQ